MCTYQYKKIRGHKESGKHDVTKKPKKTPITNHKKWRSVNFLTKFRIILLKKYIKIYIIKNCKDTQTHN